MLMNVKVLGEVCHMEKNNYFHCGLIYLKLKVFNGFSHGMLEKTIPSIENVCILRLCYTTD